MGKTSGKYWKAGMPTKAEMKKLRKIAAKEKKQVEALRERQALQDKIQKRHREIRSLRQKQSKLGKIVRKAQSEWKATEKQRKRVGKDLRKGYRELTKYND